MKNAGFVPAEAVVPTPISSLCTERLLVMKLLPGPKLYDGLRAYMRVLAEQQGKTLEQFEADERRKIEEEGVGTYDGPSATKIQWYLRFAKWKDFFLNWGRCFFNILFWWSPGMQIAYHETVLPPNSPRIVDVLMRIHGHQVNGGLWLSLS